MSSTLRSPFLQVAVLYFGLLNVLFFPALWGDRTMMPSAADQPSIVPQGAYNSSVPRTFGRLRDSGAPAWQFEPGLAVTHHIFFEEHSLPWWNPYQGFGSPWAAAMIPQPFFPLTFLASIHPSARVVNWFVVLRLFIAGLLAFSFLKLFLGAMPSAIGGLAFMLTGYFAINLNLDNLSTDILAPLVLLGFEKLFRSNSARSWLWAIASIWLVLISGMPESALLMLMFGYCYFVFRVLASSPTNTDLWQLVRRLIVCNVFAFAMSAFLLLPMLEFLQNGNDVHRGSPFGLISVPISRNILVYLLPLAEGPLYSARFITMGAGTYGYFGVSCCVLALTGMLSLFRGQAQSHRKLILFFCLALAVCLTKYFGLPPVQWLGYLPLFRIVNFPQYLQPEMALCFAALCAFGADGLLRRESRDEAVLSIMALLCVSAILAVKLGLFVAAAGPDPQFLNYSLALGGLVAAALLLICFIPARWASSRITFGALLLVMAAELGFNYIYPIYDYEQPLPQISVDAYNGAPYVEFLKKQGIGLYRVFGRQAELFPNWASAFQLFDSRFILAITPGKLFPFARAFLDVKGRAGVNELADRFTGQELVYSFSSAREQRFLQLSSTRFVVSPSVISPALSNKLIEQALEQNSELARQHATAFNETQFVIDGDPRFILFEHPPMARVPLRIQVPAGNPMFRFSPAISPALFGSKCGDGVGFALEAAGPNGKIEPLYSRYIDPKHNPLEQHWLNEKVDLTRYAGRQITLLFSTNAGPKGDANCDWAGWAGLELGTNGKSAGDEPALKLIYNAEAKVYEYAHPLPRASLFQHVSVTKNEQDALQMVADPSVDITREAIVVEPRKLSPSEKQILDGIERSLPVDVKLAEIVNFASQRVTIKANLDHDGLLMLTDGFFPGWRVYVDNRKRTLLQADYMFRGVLLEKGLHTVEFRYEDSAVMLGSSISIGAAFLALGLGYARKRLTPDPVPETTC